MEDNETVVWTTLDDGILEHPKITAVGPVGFMLFTAALIYSNRNLTDGFIPYGTARTLIPTTWTSPPGDNGHGPKIQQLAVVSGAEGKDGQEVIEDTIAALVEVGLLEEVDHGYLIHDYLDMNRSKEQVEEARQAKVSAGRAGGIASGEARAQASASRRAEAGAQADAQAKLNPHNPITPKPQHRKLSSDQTYFEEFWRHWPRKEERKGAKAKFDGIIDRGEATPEDLILGAKRYAADPNRDAAYTKLPTTWLNNGCWEDDPLPPRGRQRPRDPPRALDPMIADLQIEEALGGDD